MKNDYSSFSSIENKHHIEEIIYNETKGMNNQQLIEYFQKSVEESGLKDWWKLIKKQDYSVKTV
jgi:hypothetical protein